MELMTLDSRFQPTAVLENYASLIWTERYSTNGDFELQTNDISTMLNLLPRESYVALRDSLVPMVVETHKIEKPKNEAPKLTITGRSFDSVLERRASVKGALPLTQARAAWKMTEADAIKSSDAAWIVMRTVLGDVAQQVTAQNVTWPATNPADMASPLDAIPQLRLIPPKDFEVGGAFNTWTNATTYSLASRVKYQNVLYESVQNNNINHAVSDVLWWKVVSSQISWEIPVQDLYKTVTDMLTTNRHGIKAIRPDTNSAQVALEIYNGANLTGAGPNSDPSKVIVFDARFDQFDSATYLLSQVGSTNVGYSYGSNGAEVVNKTASAEPSGLDRRVLALNNSSDSNTSSADVRRSRALVGLYQNNATALFDGEIAQQIAAVYNRDYFLGDIVSLVGEYGLKTNARVTEFIRSADSSGESAYPTLETVTDV